MKLRKGGMFFEHFNYFGCLMIVLCYGVIYLIVQFFKIENYDLFYALPPILVFLFSIFKKNLYYFPFNKEKDENSENDKS